MGVVDQKINLVAAFPGDRRRVMKAMGCCSVVVCAVRRIMFSSRNVPIRGKEGETMAKGQIKQGKSNKPKLSVKDKKAKKAGKEDAKRTELK